MCILCLLHLADHLRVRLQQQGDGVPPPVLRRVVQRLHPIRGDDCGHVTRCGALIGYRLLAAVLDVGVRPGRQQQLHRLQVPVLSSQSDVSIVIT